MYDPLNEPSLTMLLHHPDPRCCYNISMCFELLFVSRGIKTPDSSNATGPEFGLNSKGGSDGSLPLQNLGMEEDGVEDMTRLDFLHEPAILFNLRRRFFRALPYTYTGEIVIAVNPYRWVGLLCRPSSFTLMECGLLGE